MLTPAPVQTTYTRYQPPLQNGMIASSNPWAADTRIVETAAGIGFGLAVSQGVNDRGCVIGGSNFVGITRADQTLPQAGGITVVDTYLQNDNAGIFTMGDIAVFCYAAVTAGAAVTFDPATGKPGPAGTTITHARWMNTVNGSAGTPVLNVLRLGDMSGK
jgi:hypothetical protein